HAACRPRNAAEPQRAAAQELPRHRHRDRRPPDARRRAHQPGRDEAARRAGRARRRRPTDRRQAANGSGHRRSDRTTGVEPGLELALKAVVLNLISLAATFGVVVLVFQQGHGSQLWDIPASGSVLAWIPLMIFALLYGLSMDYEVFMIGRMREAYDETGSTEKA